MFCSNCGKEIDENSKFCKYCASSQNPENSTKENIVSKPKIDEALYNEIPPVYDSTSSLSFKSNKTKNRIAILFSIVLIVGIIISLILAPIFSKKQKDNAFESAIISSDYTYTYDDSNDTTIISTFIPKYDFIDFSFTITYNCFGEYVTEEYYFNKISAGQELRYIKSLSSLKKETGEDFYYSFVSIKSGKKQNRYKQDSQKEIYNTECAFYFSWTSTHNTLSATITNKTNRPILELREFSVTIHFDDEEGLNRRLVFYCPRLKFESPLQPWETISITKLSGVSNRNWSSDGWDTVITYTKSRYSAQTYEVIFQES